MKLLNSLIVVAALSLNVAHAADRSAKMCAKVKECVLSSAAKDEIPEQMKAVVVQMVDSQCEAMATRYNAKFKKVGLQDKSNTCMDSIIEQSCNDLIAAKGSSVTPACKEFEAAANDAGVELN